MIFNVTGHTTKNEPDCLPISDNNVSTTANDTLVETETEWDNDADINVSWLQDVVLTSIHKMIHSCLIFKEKKAYENS